MATDEERKAKRAAYLRAWREANPEKVKAQARAYYQANPEKVKAQARAWREANPERSAASDRARREANPEKVAANKRAWREANPEKVAARVRAWREANPEKVAAIQRAYRSANKEKLRKNRRERMRADPQFKVAWLIRHWLKNTLKRDTTPGKFGLLLGCTASELRAYVESLFQPGMTWENKGDVWELDHIRALSSFDLLDPEQLAQAGHHTNLKPLTKAEHKAKSKADQAAARQRRKQAMEVQP